MGDWIQQIIFNMITEALTQFVSGIVDKFSSVLNNVFIIAQKVVQGDFVTKITDYTFKLAISILIFMAISQIIKLYILPEGEDPESDMTGFFIRLGKSAILISFSTVICSIFIDFTNKLANDLLKILSGKIEIAAMLKNQIKTLDGVTFGSAMVVLIMIITLIIMLFIICIQAGLRGVNLAILQMTAPIFMANYITTDKAIYNKWVQNMFSVSLTYIAQIGFTTIGLKFFAKGFDNIANVFIGFCWLIVTIQSPKLLKEITYSTGVGSGISRVGSSAMEMIRILK